GPYARLFNRQTTLTIDSPFVVVDLFGINDLPKNLKSAVVWQVCFYLKSMTFDSLDQKVKYIIIDEVARFLTIPAMVKLIDEFYTTARKHYVCVITVIQEYLKYRRAAVAETIVLNCRTLIFFSHAKSTRAKRRIVKDMEFKDREAALFSNLTTEKGKYAQALIRTTVIDKKFGGAKAIFAKLKIE